MKFRLNITLALAIFFAFSFCDKGFSQAPAGKPTRQSSLEAFSKGNYEKAYDEFRQLLTIYSKDPLYKYYAGVCLVRLEKDPAEAVKLLNQALDINTAARPLPDDVTYYLARAQHLNGDYVSASESYNKFTDQAGRKTAKELNVPDLIQQCEQNKGALEKPAIIPEIKKEPEVQPVKETLAVQVPVKVANPVTEPPKQVANPLPAEYSRLLDEALALQFIADSISNLARTQRQQLEKLPDDRKNAARSKISEYEKSADNYQRSADKKYSEAHAAMNPEEHKKDTVMQVIDNQIVKITDNETVTGGSEMKVKSDTIAVYSYFKIAEKPVNDPQSKIEIDPQVPDGLIYRIQLAVFRNPVSPVFFKGITPVYGFRSEGSELKTYYAGMFRRLTDAQSALSDVKGRGFKDSFISSFMGRKQVSSDRAAVLEKEWGVKPFERLVNQTPVVVAADTLPPTLIFRVEVMRVAKAPKPNIIESMKTLSGSRGLDIITLEDNKIAYLIGNFITFESAAEYADLIVRNGFRDAKVVAWLGSKEIPLDTAKQLFENLR
jgi:tetratricopeptide (TPR) repeat protein